MKTKRPYTAEFRAEVVRRVTAGESKRGLAKELGIDAGTIRCWVPEVTSRKQVASALRNKALERVRQGESPSKVAKDLGIGKSTVHAWTKGLGTGRLNKYPVELREQAIARAKNGDPIGKIAASLGVSTTTVSSWTKGINPRKKVPEAIRAEAVRRVEAGEVKATVARDLGISVMSVSTLTAHVLRPRAIAEPLRRTFIERINRGETLASVSRELGISTHAYKSWLKAGLAPHPPASAELQKLIVAEIKDGATIANVARKHELPVTLVTSWMRSDAGRPQKVKRPSQEERAAAVLRVANGERSKDVADSMGVSRSAISNWIRDAVARGDATIEKSVPKNDDLDFQWISKRYPRFEDWRLPMSQWIKGEVRNLGAKVAALVSFVERFLVAHSLPPTMESLLRKGQPLPDFLGSFSSTSNEGAKLNNAVHHFLQWVLLQYFSDADDDGLPVVSPLYRNPVPLVSRKGAPKRTESVREVLPYGFIVQFRERIAEGPNFRDWSFAQTALGVETLTSNNSLGDWFTVSEDRIDKNDPDCVWRLRERLQKAPVLEMWSPVRWVALLLKLMIPARTGQIRVSDSGESDTWRYEDGKFILNASPLASGTERQPWAMGSIRRVCGPGSAPAAILYFNTNKTADSLKSGPDKGQECPWPHFSAITENPYYWIEKLRNWQEKYNPISRRTKWAELPSGRSLGPKSEIQKASYADTCFLFRAPEVKGEEQWPITNAMLLRSWQKLMNAFEKAFADSGVRHPNGSPVVLNDPRNGRTFYPPHGLRVSLITAMVVDGEVPVDLMMKIVGHSRLIMTLYYTKPGFTRLRDAIAGAAEALEAKKDESILRFLTDTNNSEMVKQVAFNAESWQTVIATHPSQRNPLGWLLMHDGICFAGGNTGPLDGNQRVPGCHNGGQLIKESTDGYGAVPGGPMNCSLCRWKAAGAQHVPGLVATMNNQLYYLHQEQETAVKNSTAMSELKKLKARDEASRIPFSRMQDLRAAERMYEASMDRLAMLSSSVAGTYKMIQRLESLETASKGNASLVSAGDLQSMQAVLGETTSELLQLAGVCNDVEIYPDLNPGKAVFRRSQLLDEALGRESMPPFFMQLSEEQQLKYGNAFLNSLASQTNPDRPMLGLREIVSIMDSGESLEKLLGVQLPDFLPATGHKRLPDAPPLILALGK